MEKITEWDNILFSSLRELGLTVMSALPNIIGALILLLIGWLIARLARFVIRRVLRTKSLENVTRYLNELRWVQRSEVKVDSARLIARFVYWVILLFFFVAASETLGWTAVSQTLGDLLGYLPALLSAVIIAIVGLYIAQVVKNLILGTLLSLEMSSAKIISSFVFYIIAVFVILTALDQAGIDTTIITSNVTLILGAIMLTFAIAFALAAKDILRDILSSFYGRQNFKVGDLIKVNGMEGEIIRIDSISVVIKTPASEIVLPAHILISEKIEKLTT